MANSDRDHLVAIAEGIIRTIPETLEPIDVYFVLAMAMAGQILHTMATARERELAITMMTEAIRNAVHELTEAEMQGRSEVEKLH
jgi:uncharacterized membrane protein YoaK (UPF0700 family)